MESSDHLPGDPAPLTGQYHAINVFGSTDGESVYAEAGTRLPPLPRGFTWASFSEGRVEGKRAPGDAPVRFVGSCPGGAVRF